MNKLWLISEQAEVTFWPLNYLSSVSIPTRIKVTISGKLSLGVRLSQCFSTQAMDLTREGWGHSGVTCLMKGCQAASLLPSIPAKAEVTYPCWNMKDRAGHTEEGYQENLSSNNTFSFSPSYFTPNRSLLRPSLCPARCWARGYTVSQANWPYPPGAHSPWTKGSLTGSLRTFFPKESVALFFKGCEK